MPCLGAVTLTPTPVPPPPWFQLLSPSSISQATGVLEDEHQVPCKVAESCQSSFYQL